MKKAIGYIRVSTEKQVDGSSIDNQVDRIKAYCSLYDMDLLEIISDDGITGRNTNREGFQKLMERVTNKEIDSVVVYSLSRFSRNTVDALTNIEIMNKNNVSFHSISEKIDTGSAQGKFFMTIISALAELESNQTGERIKSVKSNNKAKLKTYTCPIFGFDSGPKKDLTINKSEMETVIYIKNIVHDHSYREIAEILNSKNIPTKKGRTWHASTVYAIANNHLYAIANGR